MKLNKKAVIVIVAAIVCVVLALFCTAKCTWTTRTWFTRPDGSVEETVREGRKDGSVLTTKTITTENGMVYTTRVLEKDGHEIPYTVDEYAVDEYVIDE